MSKSRLLLIAALLFGAATRAFAAELREASGLVHIRRALEDAWRPATKPPNRLAEGDGLRTGFNARAQMVFSAGFSVEAKGNAHVSVEADGPARASIHLLFGSIFATARVEGGVTASVRTPTAVVRARAPRTAFRVTVGGGGGTVIEAVLGPVGVEDNRGRAVLLATGERVEADLAGLHEPGRAPTPTQARKIDFSSMMRRELARDLEGDAALDEAARQSRREEHELGRVLTDASGARVRSEEFVVRRSADRLALVALNGRPGLSAHHFWEGTFDRALPRDLAAVFAGLAGSLDAPTAWTLTSYEAVWSNGTDSIAARAAGGHQVDLNANANPGDDLAGVYDPETDLYRSAAARAAYATLFDRYGLYANGVLKRGWTGANLQTLDDATPSTTNDPLTGALLGTPLPSYTSNVSLPDAGAARRAALEDYSDGTRLTRDDTSFGFGGAAVARDAFGSAASGDGYRRRALDYALQVDWGAAEFAGRRIVVIVSPRLAIVTGGLP